MNEILDNLTCFIGMLMALVVIALLTGFKKIPDFQRLVVFRLGRPLDKPKGPGIVFLIPVIDKGITVDLREQKRDVFNQIALTHDELYVLVTFRWNYKIINPVDSILNIRNFQAAAQAMVSTSLRAKLGSLKWDDIPTELEKITEIARASLEEVTERWGVKVIDFEILKIALDDHTMEMRKANFKMGTFGETQTAVHTSGTVLIGNETWDAISDNPIPPQTRVRVKSVVLEVEDVTPSTASVSG